MTDTLPPRWAIEGFCHETGYSDASAFADHMLKFPTSDKSTIHGARLYALAEYNKVRAASKKASFSPAKALKDSLNR